MFSFSTIFALAGSYELIIQFSEKKNKPKTSNGKTKIKKEITFGKMCSHILLFIASEGFRPKKINRSFKTAYLYLYVVGFIFHSVKSLLKSLT